MRLDVILAHARVLLLELEHQLRHLLQVLVQARDVVQLDEADDVVLVDQTLDHFVQHGFGIIDDAGVVGVICARKDGVGQGRVSPLGVLLRLQLRTASVVTADDVEVVHVLGVDLRLILVGLVRVGTHRLLGFRTVGRSLHFLLGRHLHGETVRV